MKTENTRRRENKLEALKYIDRQRPYKLNSIKISAVNTYAHERMKFEICYQLTKEGKDFITEVYFVNSKKHCDILIPEDFKIIEILGTEKIEECKEKVKNYPDAFEKVFVDANQPFNEKLIY